MNEPRLKIATCSLAGCFGCHMSLLDLDERLFELAERIELDRSPLTDIKELGFCDIGLIEGGVCNAENVHVLLEFRARCKTLVAIGACALNGGVPALRNQFALSDCLEESYLRGIGLMNAQIPSDPELPLLLNKVHPLHEIVRIDYFLPGCPPAADAIWTFISQLLSGQPPALSYTQIHYD